MGSLLGCYIMPHPPIIIPTIGKGEEEKIKNTIKSCNNIADEINALKPDTIIIITPHGTMFQDAISITEKPNLTGDLSRFGDYTTNFNKRINISLTESIIEKSSQEKISTASINEISAKRYGIQCELDHGSMIPLYFIDKKYQDYELVHITYGFLSYMNLYKFGILINKALEESSTNAVIIASGDLSHRLKEDGPYGFNANGPEFDKRIIDFLTHGEVIEIFNLDKKLTEEAGECGLRSFFILLGAMDGYEPNGKLLSYEGPFGVGYGVLSFHLGKAADRYFYDEILELQNKKLTSKKNFSNPYVRLAYDSINYYFKYNEFMSIPNYVPKEMTTVKRGVFVSLKEHGELRGCIGTIYPCTESCAEEIIHNAISAAIHDPRFLPVKEEELQDITISVDVLLPPEKAERKDLDVKKYGVIVRFKGKSGLLLPDLEGVDTIEEQINIALNKAGISPKDKYTLERFEVIRYR